MRTAFSIIDLEADPSLVSDLVTDCPVCDPDNPKAVDRAHCPACGGTGVKPVTVGLVVNELKKSKLELLNGGKKKSAPRDEYVDPDDVFID